MKMTSDIDRLKETFASGMYVKVSYKDEIRKFKILDHERPYDDILNVLSHQYNLDTYNNGNVRLSYIDDDQDEITVSSNREVVDALNSVSKTGCCIKLKIKDYNDESGSDCGEPMAQQSQHSQSQPQLEQDQGSAIQSEMTDTSDQSDLQMEIDNVITGVRGSRNVNEDPVVVPNIFTSFQSKPKRQFEIEEGLVVCRLCPSGRTMLPTIDLNVIKSHAKSDIHIMALTYHVLGEWPTLPTLPTLPNSQFKLDKTDLLKNERWKSLDNTAAQLLAAKYHHHLNKPVGQRRKRTSFSPATTLSLEKFANSIQWKRGESEKINEFAKKHGLTFYQVKVWMNNHRPRKNLPHHTANSHYMSTTGSFYNTNNSVDHAREINKVIAALEEPLQLKTELNTGSGIPVGFGLTGNNNLRGVLTNALNTSSLGLNIPTTLNVPTTLGLFNSTSTCSEGSPANSGSVSPKTASSPIVSSPFFSPHSRFSSPFSLPSITSSPFSLPTITPTTSLPSLSSLPTSLSNSNLTAALPEHQQIKCENGSPMTETAPKMEKSSFSPVPKSTHPLSLDTVSLDSAFRPPSFTSNLHNIFTRHGQESTSSGS